MPTYNSPSTPSWWKAIKDRLAQMNQIAAQGTVVPKSTVPGATTPRPPSAPGTDSYVMPTTPNPYNATPPSTATPPPTGSFIGGGGQYVQTSVGPMSTVAPTGSFIAGGGQFVLGPNQQAYNIAPTPNSTFIGAGGEAVRGPDTTLETISPPGGGGYGGYGYGRRRGGGRGGGAPSGRYASQPNSAPAWARGLAAWNIG